MSETGSVAPHRGSCHCGAVRFVLHTPPITQAMVCNCSMCRRAGWMLVFRPQAQFELLSGRAELRDYQFGPKTLHHEFCGVCGVRAFSRGEGHDGSDWVGVNLRCVDGAALDAVELNAFDGASL